MHHALCLGELKRYELFGSSFEGLQNIAVVALIDGFPEVFYGSACIYGMNAGILNRFVLIVQGKLDM
jgi:hypothetical protein